MPSLLQSLQGYDLGHLRIVAGLWGLELRSNNVAASTRELAEALLEAQLADEVIASLNPEAGAALKALGRAGGRIPWAIFTRRFGNIREMGAGRRDRLKPYLKPTSAAESLFYRALLARAFFDTDTGPQEFGYLPDDLLFMIQSSLSGELPASAQPAGRRATPTERGHVFPADDRILDDATTLLAALRIGRNTQTDPVLHGLLGEAGLLKKNALQAAAVKTFLESSRTNALKMLVRAWRTSVRFNELRMVPGLNCEGEWINQPFAAREFVLKLLSAIPKGTWWSLNSFIAAVKTTYPDFERPAGDYDSWFIRSTVHGRYLRGFADWDEVDGALIRFLMTGVMHRLGMLDLAAPATGKDPAAFRVTNLGNHPSGFQTAENGKLHVTSSGTITAPRLVPRAVRYQLARLCEWDDERPDEYRFHITTQSLTRAAAQGLKVEHLLALLAKHTDAGLPPVFIKALKRWEANGTEARAVTQGVLRVSRPEILAQLRKSRAARFLDEPLGPTAALIKPGTHSRVLAALVEMGLLGQDDTASTAGSGSPP